MGDEGGGGGGAGLVFLYWPQVSVGEKAVPESDWIAIHHIYINCRLPVYRWSIMNKQVTITPPPPITERGGGGFWLPVLTFLTPVDWEPAINVDMVKVTWWIY